MISWTINNTVKRRKSREILVGNVGIGGFNPVRIQSMTNTDTVDYLPEIWTMTVTMN